MLDGEHMHTPQPTPLIRPQLGDLAPQIALQDVSAGVWRLDEQRGQTIVLFFHRHIH